MFKSNWWLLFFCLAICLFQSHFLQGKKRALASLNLRLVEMENERTRALQKRDDLQLRLASQNDPAWVEMVLMRDLGVVPEGFLKVHFKK